MSDCKTNIHCDTTSISPHNEKEGGCDVSRYMEKLAEQAIHTWRNKMANKEAKKEYEHKLFAAMKGE